MSEQLTIQERFVDVNENVTHLKDYPEVIKQTLINFHTMNETIGELTSVEKRNDLNAQYDILKKTRSTFKEKRLKVTRVLKEIKDTIMAYENEESKELDDVITNIYNKILLYDKAAEELRQQKIQEQQQAIAEEQRKIDARNARHQSLLEGIGKINGLLPQIKLVSTPDNLDVYEKKLQQIIGWQPKALTVAREFDRVDFVNNAIAALQNEIAEARERCARIAEMSEDEKKKQEEQAKAKAIEIEEQMKQDKIQQAELEQAQYEEQQKKFEELKKLKDEKLKSLKLGFDIEVKDINAVPSEYVKREIIKSKIRPKIKAGQWIEGLKITLKDGTELTKDDINIL